MNLWPHQQYGVYEVLAAIRRGARRILVTTPTGGGKTEQARTLIRAFLLENQKVAMYCNRRMLIEQLSREMSRGDIDHGVRAAGEADEREFNFQICSIATENSRTSKGIWRLHDADKILVDEAHVIKGPTAKKILDTHIEQGGTYIGYTATPLGLAEMYDELIVAGTNSQLRACGALVPAIHYGPDEPDLRHIGKVKLGEDLTEKQNVKAIMVHGIFARVEEWLLKLNPELKPTILFAPDVPSSLYFAEELHRSGISAAHISGEEVWINGETYRADKEARKRMLDASRTGHIKVVCNRFVLREGIDAPWLAHGILATVFGSLQSYLQSGGRLLRSHPGLDTVTIQDHGGNWHRHGSLNEDRHWRLEYTPEMVAGLREERLRKKDRGITEPTRCPRCGMILAGSKCPCGFQIDLSKKSRMVVQADGSLKEMRGDIYRPKRISKAPDGPKIWEKMYHRSMNGKGERTFRAAMALFAMENNWQYPDPTWPLMPKNEHDLFRLVKDVPKERLTT